MDNNFLSGGITELEHAKLAVQINNSKQQELLELETRLRKKEKELENQKRYMADKVESAIKERRNSLKKGLDAQVEEANKKLKTADRKKKKAKDAAVGARIKNDTFNFRDDTKRRKKENAALFKANKVPAFCNTSYYYSMFAPRRFKDIIAIIITTVITLGVIPNIICSFIKSDSLLLRIIIYSAIVVIFVLLYVLIYMSTHSGTKGEAIVKGRANIDAAYANKKEVKKITKDIKADSDESQYNLQEYDREIERFQGEFSEAEKKREEALKQFDKETALAIKDEIEKESLEVIDKLKKEQESLKQIYGEKEETVKQVSAELNETYGAFLGTKNLSEEKIDELIAFIKDGKAQTIMQALDLLNGEIK